MMKRIVATLFFLSIILAALALVAPSFIDWSQHKDRIIAQLKPYLGRKIDVGGQVKFRLIPNPQILLEDVTLSNAEGAKADHFMKLKQLEAHVKFEPLLQGRFEVESINLDHPDVDLEVLDDGSANWTGILKEREEGSASLDNAADAIQFNQITTTGGTLHYLNQVTGASWQVDDLNLTVSADTLFGPYKVSGQMQYKGTQVGVDGGTGKFGADAVPVHMAFNPVEGLPQVKLDGTMDLHTGVSLQGDLSIQQGNLASLFDSDFLKKFAFLNDEADFSAKLDVKDADAKFGAIQAKFGKKGELSGAIDILFEKGKKPALVADLSGSNLKAAAKPEFMAVPGGFDVRLKFKGKNVNWQGTALPAVNVAIDTDKEEWVVKNARFDLPGKSVVKIAGVATPKSKYAAYSIQATTDDLASLLKALPVSEEDYLKVFGESGLVKKMEWESTLDIKPDGLSFSDINAQFDGKTKASGVVNLDRGVKKPSFNVALNLDGVDMAAFTPEAWKNFTDGIMKSDAELEIATKNFTIGDLKLPELDLNVKTGEPGLQVKNISGTFADGGDFRINGTVAGISPLKTVDVVYNLKTPALGPVAKALGAELPPPLKEDVAVDIHGHIGGDAQKFTFNADGGGVQVNGTAQAGADGVRTYQNAIHLDKAPPGGVFAWLGLPIDRLVSAPDSLNAELSGTRVNYKLDKIDAGAVSSGTITRKEGKFEGELTAAALDFDDWLWNGWSVKDDFSLRLKAKKMTWRGNEIVGPALTLEAGADKLRAKNLTGQMWGGNVTAAVDAHRKGADWTGSLKGSIKGATLSQLSELMSLKGVSPGNGDLDFDLASDSRKEDKQWFHGTNGTLDVTADALTVEGFHPAALPEMISSLKKPSDDLAPQVAKALASDATVYKDVKGSFKIADGKMTIGSLKLADTGTVAEVAGACDLGPSTYHLTADITLASPPGVPPLRVSRSGDLKGAPDYTVNVKPLEEYLAKRAAKDDIKAAAGPDATPQPPETQPDVQKAPDTLQEAKPEIRKMPEAAQPEQLSPEEDKPVRLTPPSDSKAPLPTTETPSMPPPPADTGEGGNLNEPIETEQLEAPPAPPPPPAPPKPDSATNPPAPSPEPPQGETPPPHTLEPPAPAPAPAVPPKGDSPIKGILDRLNDQPGDKDAAPPEGDPEKQ